MTMSDYFLKHNYEGEIYKTVNLRNLSLNQYCKDDSSVKKEQKNIEKQLTDFRGNLWKVQTAENADSATVAASDSVAGNNAAKAVKEQKPKRTTQKKADTQATKKSSSGSSKSGGAPRVSVRRTRR